MAEDYSIVTELPGNKAPREQLERLYQRYAFALPFCSGKEVLEVACGGGIGLGFLARQAKKVTGGDIDEPVLEYARKHYQNRENIQVEILDAQNIPYQENSFDTVILYEALYYLPRPEQFISEAKRILRKEGTLLICSANKEWPDFNPSPYSRQYFTAAELVSLLKQVFSRIEIYGGFPVSKKGIKSTVISFIKRAAVSLHLIPKSMKGKEKFKRLFFGKLTPLPDELEEGMCEYFPPALLEPDSRSSRYKVIFAVARS